MNTSGHQFRRYVRSMTGRKIVVQTLCECGRLSRSYPSEGDAWADYCQHSDIEARKQVPNG